MAYYQVLDDDGDEPLQTLEMTVRVTGHSDDIGHLLDTLSQMDAPTVVFDPPGWVRTFYGWEVDQWR
jgi:hypothetical protein